MAAAWRVHRQLLGRDHAKRGLDPLSQLSLASEDGDLALGPDADPGIKRGRVGHAAWQVRPFRLLGAHALAKGEGHDEPAARPEEAAAGEVQ